MTLRGSVSSWSRWLVVMQFDRSTQDGIGNPRRGHHPSPSGIKWPSDPICVENVCPAAAVMPVSQSNPTLVKGT